MRRIDALADVARSIAVAGTPGDWGARAVAAVERATGWQRVFLFRGQDAAGVLELVAAQGVTSDEERESAQLPLVGASLSALAARSGAPVVSGRAALPEPEEANRLANGFPAFAALPLIARGRVLGTLTLVATDSREVDDEELAFLAAVADQLATGLESSRLYEDARRREAQAVFLSEVADLFASSMDADAVLRLVVQRCVGVLGDACGVLMNPLHPERDDRLLVAAVHHRRSEMVPRIRSLLEALPARYGRGLAGAAAASGRPLLLTDLDDPALELSSETREWVRRGEVRSCIVTPLRTQRGVLGVLACVTTAEPDADQQPAPLFGARVGGPLRPADLDLALEVCHRAASALEKAHLYRVAEDSRRRLRQVFSQMADAVLVLDPVGRIAEFNEQAERLLGGPLKTGQTLDEVPYLAEDRHEDGTPLPWDERPSALALASGRAVTNVPFTLVRTDGAEVEVSASAAPLHDDAGMVTGAVTVLRDVSDLRRLERAKDSFLSVASHELRTPLTPLKGLTQILLRQLERADGDVGRLDLDRIARYLHTMDSQVDRLADLVNDLLDVSRMEAGRLQLRPAPTDLVAAVVSVVRRFETVAQVELRVPDQAGGPRRGRATRQRTAARPAAAIAAPDAAADTGSQEGHRIVFAPDVAELTGLWDQERLEQVVANLIANALKYSPRGGDVVVTLAREAGAGGVAHLAVHDSGIGIPEGASAELFRPFSRLANAPAEHFGGLGLGLYIAYDIVERHGGRIWAESRGAGQGATFHVSLPNREPDTEPAPQVAAAP